MGSWYKLYAGTSGGGAFAVQVDEVAPTVALITRTSPNPTNATSVNFLVTFSEMVTGVDTSDFGLTTTGSISGASVTSVGGSGAVYAVTVNTGSNSGTLRLDVPTTAVVTDLGGNPLAGLPFTTGEVYDVQKNVYFYLPVMVRWMNL